MFNPIVPDTSLWPGLSSFDAMQSHGQYQRNQCTPHHKPADILPLAMDRHYHCDDGRANKLAKMRSLNDHSIDSADTL